MSDQPLSLNNKIILCNKCQKPVTVNQYYKIDLDDGVEHVDCFNPDGKEVEMNSIKREGFEFTLKPSRG